MQITPKARLISIIIALVFMFGALAGTGAYLIINHINNTNALKGGSSIGDIIDTSNRSLVNYSVYLALMDRLGSRTGHVGTLDQGTPIVFKMAGRDWQVVYRDPNNSDIITVWMTEPYTTGQFYTSDSLITYTNSTIRKTVQNYYTTQASTYTVLTSIVRAPNQMSESYKDEQDEEGSGNGLGSRDSAISSYGNSDMFWLPSLYEIYSFWGLDSNDREFDNTRISGSCWLRSCRITYNSIALLVNASGYAVFDHVDESYGIRPAAHISLSALAAAAIQYNIIVQSNNDSWGTVSGGGAFGPNTATILTATPATGYNFVGWQLNGEIVSTSASYQITVTVDATYTAVFEPKTYAITANANDTNQGAVSGGGSYQHNAEVTITATPMEHYNFAYFQVGNQQITQNPYKFNATENLTVTAYFTPKSYTITITTTNGGQILKDNTLQTTIQVTQNYNTQITSLYAIPNAGYGFVYWLDESTGATYDTNPLTYTVDNNTTLTAVFGVMGANGVVVSATYGGTVMLVGDDFENLNDNDTILYIAKLAQNGYRFDHWEDGQGNILGTDSNLTLTKAEAYNIKVTAVFVPISNQNDMNAETDNGYIDDFV